MVDTTFLGETIYLLIDFAFGLLSEIFNLSGVNSLLGILTEVFGDLV